MRVVLPGHCIASLMGAQRLNRAAAQAHANIMPQRPIQRNAKKSCQIGQS
jgi:hypothetical protein